MNMQRRHLLKSTYFNRRVIQFLVLLFLFAFNIINSNAQDRSFRESFEDINNLTGKGWVMINNTQNWGSNSTPISSNWYQGLEGNGSFYGYIPSRESEGRLGKIGEFIGAGLNNVDNTDGGFIDMWLLTPERLIKNGDILTFYTRKAEEKLNDRLDKLDIRMSSDGASIDVGSRSAGTFGSFTKVLGTIDKGSPDSYRYPNDWTQFRIVIKDLPSEGVSGRFAFNYNVGQAGRNRVNGTLIGIDDVYFYENRAPTDIKLDKDIVNQSEGINAIVGNLTTVDKDLELGIPDEHTYTLLKVDDREIKPSDRPIDKKFDIVENNGVWSIKTVWNPLVAKKYKLLIKSTDKDGQSTEKTIEIKVIDDIHPTMTYELLPYETGMRVGKISTIKFKFSENVVYPGELNIRSSGSNSHMYLDGADLLDIVDIKPREWTMTFRPNNSGSRPFKAIIQMSNKGAVDDAGNGAYFDLLIDINNPVTVNTTKNTDVYVKHIDPEPKPLILHKGITIANVNGRQLKSAKVSIANNYQSAEDVLALVSNQATMGNIKGVFDNATGVLTLTSEENSANLEQWEAALSAVTYLNNSENPKTVERKVTFEADDGYYSDEPAVMYIAIRAMNQPPVISAPKTQTLNRDEELVFNAADNNAILVSDADAGTSKLGLTISVSNGVLKYEQEEKSEWSLSYSLAEINNFFEKVKFIPNTGFVGAASITVGVDDNGNTGFDGPKTTSHTIDITVNSVEPIVTSVGSTNPNGSYKEGNVIMIQVHFDQFVAVHSANGTPTLLLETGVVDRQAVYVSGSGTGVLTFSYEVQAGDASADLDYTTIKALSLNGSTISNPSGDNAVLTLPGIGSPNSLAGQHDIIIDNIEPKIRYVEAPENKYYKAGEQLDFKVNFSETVLVNSATGAPKLTIDIGGQKIDADYESGSGTTALVFRYTVVSGDQDHNGIEIGELSLNGGTIVDAAGNNAILILNNVSTTTGVKVDAKTPEFSIVINNGADYTNSVSVTVEVISNDEDLSIIEFSNDNAKWSDEEPYVATKSWDLPVDDGPKKVYVRIKDLGENEVVNSAEITLDQVAPIVDGVEDGKMYNTDRIITFNEGEGILNEEIFASGTVVSDNGDYRLVVTDDAGNSTTVNFEIDKIAPAQPDNFAALADDGLVKLTWNTNTEDDFKEYKIYWGLDENTVNVITIDKGTEDYTHSNLTNGTVYYYKISALDVLGNESVLSDPVDATPKGVQTITFNALPNATFKDDPIALIASATSGLTPIFESSDPTIASIVNSTLTIHKAGTVTITAIQEGDNTWFPANDVSQSLTINKATISDVSFSGGSFVYDGTAKSLAITGELPSGTSVSYIDNEKIDVGVYTVTADIDGGTNYEDFILTADLTIEKAPITTVAIADASFVYDGAAKSLIITGELPSGTSVSYMGNEQTDAGVYKVTADIKGGDNYNDLTISADLTIEKAPISTITISDAHFVYDGMPKSLTITGVLPSGTSVSYMGNEQTDAGVYKVTADIKGGDNYNDLTVSADLTIEKAPITTVAIADGSFVYDGVAKSLAITGELPSGTSVSYTGNEQTDAGVYKVTADIKGGANYNDLTVSADLIIEKEPITNIALVDVSFVYDGTAKSLAITGELPSGASASYTGNEQTDAGVYKVTADIKGGANYNDLTVSADLTIEKAPITNIALVDASFVYDGTAKSLSITGELPPGASVSYMSNEQIDAGVYKVTANVDGGANYNDLLLTAELTIEKVQITQITMDDAHFTYDGKEHSLAIKGNLPTGAKVTYIGNGQSEAGVYSITASIDGGNNYYNTILSAELSINPAIVTGVKLDDAAFIYDGAEKSLVLKGKLPVGTLVTYTDNHRIDAGSQVVTAHINGGANYDDLTLTAELSITKANSVIAFTEIPVQSRDAGVIQLDIRSNNPLPIHLYSDNELVAVITDDNQIEVRGVGRAMIRAEQDGDANHKVATSVSRELRVQNDADAKLPVRVHQALSPNGDGVNDFLRIEGIEEYPDNSLRIFNSNGLVLYETKGYNNSTDRFEGNTIGGRLPSGTYYYVLELKVDGKYIYDKGYFVIRY